MSVPPPERAAPDPDYVKSLKTKLLESFDDFDRRMTAAEQQTNTAQGDPS